MITYRSDTSDPKLDRLYNSRVLLLDTHCRDNSQKKKKKTSFNVGNLQRFQNALCIFARENCPLERVMSFLSNEKSTVRRRFL